MIKLLKEKDRESVLEYLYKDKNFNIFPIGDIEAFGFDSVFQKIYGEFDKEGNYLSILLLYRENVIYYSHLEYFNEEYLNLLKTMHYRYFSGKLELIDLIHPHLGNCKRQPMYFSHATKIVQDLRESQYKGRMLKTKEDCGKLYDLLATIDEFGVSKQTKEHFIESKYKSLNMGTTLYVEENDEFIGTVATTAETTVNAMVVGVATRKGFRKKGLATTLMLDLMDKYINEKKKDLCLFYDNPEAGKIYLRLGFENIGRWVMLSF